MKKTLLMLVILCVSFIVIKAQSNNNFTSKKEVKFLAEYSVDPSHLTKPTDFRGGLGLKINNDSMSTELIISYEEFKKSENRFYRGVDFSLIRLASLKSHPKFSGGIGIRLGGILDYGASMGGFIKGEYQISKFCILSGQLGFGGALRWGCFTDGRVNIIFIIP